LLLLDRRLTPEPAQSALAPDALLIQKGTASYYGRKFYLKKNSNGEIFHMDSLTAAHKTLPFDTWVRVSRPDTDDFVWVRINDRLPKISKRIIDLSRKAGTQLGLLEDWIARVRMEVEKPSEIERLIEYFGENPPTTMRLRPVDEVIIPPVLEIDTSISSF
jgi:rare lipoprotein A